jgi:hypothetical protein
MFKGRSIVIVAAAVFLLSFVSCKKSSTGPSPVSTPDPIIIDNFTDGDLANSISSSYTNNWYATSSSGGSCTGPTISTYDGYCAAVTGTAKANNGTGPYIGTYVLGTGLLASAATYLDASAQTGFSCKIRYDIISAGSGTLSYYIQFNASSGDALRINLTPAGGAWQTVSVRFADMEKLGSSTIQQIVSSLSFMEFNVVFSSATLNDTAVVAMYLDDVKFDR